MLSTGDKRTSPAEGVPDLMKLTIYQEETDIDQIAHTYTAM